MSIVLHVDSPQVRETARKIYPNAASLSARQREVALFFTKLFENYPDDTAYQLLTLAELAPLYRPGYSHLPPNEKKAVRDSIKRHVKDLVSASARLPLTLVPVPELAWDLQDAGQYPPPIFPQGLDGVCADDLYRPGWSVYGVNITVDPDGAVPTAYTHSGKGKGRGFIRVNEGRERGWTEQGRLTDGVCDARGIPTRKQLNPGFPVVITK